MIITSGTCVLEETLISNNVSQIALCPKFRTKYDIKILLNYNICYKSVKIFIYKLYTGKSLL